MSRAAWAAIVAAIAFPTVALVVVLLSRPEPPRPPAPPGPPVRNPGPPAPPPLFGGGPPGGAPEEALVRLRKRLDLSDEQVDGIWKIAGSARRRAVELEGLIEEKEAALHSLLESESPDEETVAERVDELSELHAERRKLAVLTPLRVRNTLTSAQRTKLLNIWRSEGTAAAPGERPDASPSPIVPFGTKGPPPGAPWGTKGPPPGAPWGTKGPPPGAPWGTKAPPPPPPRSGRAADLENPFETPDRRPPAGSPPAVIDPFAPRSSRPD